MSCFFGQPWIDECEVQAVSKVLRSGWIGQGPVVDEFEEALKAYLDTDHVIAVSSCTSALLLAVNSLALKPGDKVLVPTMTFVSTVNIVIELGLEVVFADCDERTFNMVVPSRPDPEIKAVIPVHFAGRPCDLDMLHSAASKYGWKIVEDAAHALGASYDGVKVGASKNLACFSFYPNKNMTTIEGGAICFKRGQAGAALAEEFKCQRVHGLCKDAWKRFSATNVQASLMGMFGWKFNMTDIQAAVGCCQLKKFSAIQERRQRYWDMYAENLQELPLTLPLGGGCKIEHSPHLFIVLVHEGMRDQLRRYLSDKGIATGIHYIPVHQHPFYANRYPFVSCPVAEEVGKSCLSLPLSAAMEDVDIKAVIKAIQDFFV